uniref:Reverse transcriptase domain-containing protein n=1 Tax=Ficedula albicollis TaxID=59894 RepID=A0A803VHT8_FICAL
MSPLSGLTTHNRPTAQGGPIRMGENSGSDFGGGVWFRAPVRLSRVSVGSQTSPSDWVDLVSWNFHFLPGSKSNARGVDPASRHGVDLYSKNDQVDLVAQNLPSKLSPDSAENDLAVLANLEFYRSDLHGYDGVHFSAIREGLSGLPEVYEQLAPQPCAGDSSHSSLPRDAKLFVLEQRSSEEESEDAPKTSPPTPGEPGEQAPEETVTVTVPDKNPPCPCCGTRINSVLGLIEHLKGSHGKKRICFRCVKCGKEGTNYHSVVCHFPKCRGPETEAAPAGEWICEVCGRDFQTKIGLGQHKRHAHPLLRNQERIAASHPKETSNRGAHKRCWTKEEEEMLIKLEAQFEGHKNINKLIAEHITTKTNKQISDKRRLLPRKPDKEVEEEPAVSTRTRRAAAGLRKEPGVSHQCQAVAEDNGPGRSLLPGKPAAGKKTMDEISHRPDKGNGRRGAIKQQGAGQLQAHYHRTLGERLSAGAINTFPQAFKQLMEGREMQTTINQSAQDCFGCLESISQIRTATRDKNNKGAREKQPKRPFQKWMKDRAIKKGDYLRFQRLFHLDRGKLARIILDDIEALSCDIPPSEIYSVFKDRWETPGNFKSLGEFQSNGKADNSAFRDLITAKEIEKNVQEMSKGSAPGPDGITLGDIKKMDPEYSLTAEIFNLWLTSGKIPDMVRGCRTVLIPKSTEPERLKDTNNWRPITIGSILLRLFSRIVTARLSKACPLNPRQRGFIRAAGCSENLKLLQSVMRSAKKEHRPLGVVFVDFAKAFDTISHQHIIHALQQREVDPHIIGLVSNTYKDTSTYITVKKNTHTDEIHFRVGVKQGDPMSPLLFNLAMDPLLCKLEESGKGYHRGRNSITAMAFADDLVLLSDSWENMKTNIKILETFCNLTGLRTQGVKCHGFYIKPTKDSYTVNDCAAWTINGTPLKMIDPGETEKYLGLQIDPWTGIAKSNLSTKLEYWLQRIDQAPLKPLQRIDILKTYAIPRLTYLADHSELKAGFLESLDQKIRTTVKDWLHLPSCTCDAILYSSTKDGGLGITKLAGLIPSVQARRLHRIAQSSDETMKMFLEKDRMEQMYKKLWIQA